MGQALQIACLFCHLRFSVLLAAVTLCLYLNQVANILLFRCGRRVADNLNVVIAMGDTDADVRGAAVMAQGTKNATHSCP